MPNSPEWALWEVASALIEHARDPDVNFNSYISGDWCRATSDGKGLACSIQFSIRRDALVIEVRGVDDGTWHVKFDTKPPVEGHLRLPLEGAPEMVSTVADRL